MALAKRVKNGGSFYQGYRLDVASATGDYLLAICPATNNFAVNGISVTPSSTGDGDYFSISHMNTTSTAGGGTVALIASSVYNIGAGITIGLDLASLELVNPGESLRFTYTNIATKAMTIFVTVEVIR